MSVSVCNLSHLPINVGDKAMLFVFKQYKDVTSANFGHTYPMSGWSPVLANIPVVIENEFYNFSFVNDRDVVKFESFLEDYTKLDDAVWPPDTVVFDSKALNLSKWLEHFSTLNRNLAKLGHIPPSLSEYRRRISPYLFYFIRNDVFEKILQPELSFGYKVINEEIHIKESQRIKAALQRQNIIPYGEFDSHDASALIVLEDNLRFIGKIVAPTCYSEANDEGVAAFYNKISALCDVYPQKDYSGYLKRENGAVLVGDPRKKPPEVFKSVRDIVNEWRLK